MDAGEDRANAHYARRRTEGRSLDPLMQSVGIGTGLHVSDKNTLFVHRLGAAAIIGQMCSRGAVIAR